MTITLLKGKLHRVKVTEAELYYEGSISIDEQLLEAAKIVPFERVQVVNVNNGNRLETYAIPAPRGSRTICLNGAAARMTSTGDEVIIMAYCDLKERELKEHQPRVVLVDDKNNPIEIIDKKVEDLTVNDYAAMM